MSELVIRPMYGPDLEHGFFETLSALRPITMQPERAREVFRARMRDKLFTVVAVRGDEVVGTATLFMETKFIHDGGIVGHIEDVAVRPEVQGQGVGQKLVQYLVEESRKQGAYKVILDCAPHLISFYEKLGLKHWAEGMRIDLDH